MRGALVPPDRVPGWADRVAAGGQRQQQHAFAPAPTITCAADAPAGSWEHVGCKERDVGVGSWARGRV